MSVDPTDLAIIALLREDGRMSNREAGRALEYRKARCASA